MIKQVIVIRKDLKMRRGKEIAQASHASMSFITKRIDMTTGFIKFSIEEEEWLRGSFTKIVLYCADLLELEEIAIKARGLGLEVHIITDNGKTEFHGELTVTCLAIGPGESEKIDLVTGNLKLA